MSENGQYETPGYTLPPINPIVEATPITIDGVDIKINEDSVEFKAPSNSIERSNTILITLEAEYGAVIIYTNNGTTYYKVIGSGVGKTTNEIENGEANPIWKKYSTSFIPEGSGNSIAQIYIYNKDIAISTSNPMNYRRPWVRVDDTIVSLDTSYITNKMGSSASPLNMDSYSSFEVDTPNATVQVENLEFLATTLTSTGCTITVSGSTTSGFHTPGIDAGNDSSTLQFGKDDNEVLWASWMPFLGTPFNDLSEGVHITSASLTFTATADVTSTPTKTAYITTGLESEATPAVPTTYSEIIGKGISSALNTPILDSWVTGEEYTIDITKSVKAKLGEKAIIWGGGSIAAIVKNSNSAIGGYRSIASGSHVAYSAPKLTIGYVKNGYPRNAICTLISKGNPTKNYYNYTTINIGGSSSTSTAMRGLVYFNLGGIPAGTVNSAYIRLRQSPYPESTGTHTFNVHRITSGTKWDFYTTTWNQKFGAGANKAWTSAGGEYNATVLATKSGVANVSVGTARDITFTTAGKAVLRDMISGTTPNNGFLIKDSVESTNSRIQFISGNHTSVGARPTLVITVDGVTYTVQYTGPSEDIAPAPPPAPPTPPTPPAPGPSQGLPVKLIYAPQSMLVTTTNTVEYTLKGAADTNRYLLVSEGWFDNNWSYGFDAHFTSLKFNGIAMTKVVGVESDESNVVMWGLAIPNDWQPNYTMMFVGDRKPAQTKYTEVGDSRIYLYVREFAHVNQTNPVYNTYALRKGANATTYEIIGEVPYVAKGFAADSIFLCNSEVPIPRKGFSDQIVDYATVQRCSSHFSPGASVGGITKFGWSWSHTGYIGSEAAIVIVSLKPE
jgi:hypothetical protein